MKARQSAKIQKLGQALIDTGLCTLDDQANALGRPRSTAWTILKACHKSTGLSAMIIERMRSPNATAKSEVDVRKSAAAIARDQTGFTGTAVR